MTWKRTLEVRVNGTTYVIIRMFRYIFVLNRSMKVFCCRSVVDAWLRHPRSPITHVYEALELHAVNCVSRRYVCRTHDGNVGRDPQRVHMHCARKMTMCVGGKWTKNRDRTAGGKISFWHRPQLFEPAKCGKIGVFASPVFLSNNFWESVYLTGSLNKNTQSMRFRWNWNRSTSQKQSNSIGDFSINISSKVMIQDVILCQNTCRIRIWKPFVSTRCPRQAMCSFIQNLHGTTPCSEPGKDLYIKYWNK